MKPSMTAQLGRILALIPAKEGSKRLPRKNILNFAGMTLLERTINTAKKCDVFDYICVSTESEAVAKIAKKSGITLPFMRPKKLAHDPASVIDVAMHALRNLEEIGEFFETMIILLPTSPFRLCSDIDNAINEYLEQKVDFLMSVVQETHSPLSSLLYKEGGLTPLHPEWIYKTGAYSTKSTPQLVRSNGAITIVNVSRFREVGSYYGYPLGSYEMPLNRSLDIDTEIDFLFGEFLAELHPEWLAS